MSEGRRRNALVRLGVPPCQQCGRPSHRLKLIAIPDPGSPNCTRFTARKLCPVCIAHYERQKQLWEEEQLRKERFEQQQHEIRMHQIQMDNARANPDYVRGCMEMQHELNDLLRGWGY